MKPEERIVAHLHAQRGKVQYSTMDIVIKDIKLFLFYGMPPIPDDEIRKVVSQWATVYAIGLLIKPQAGDSPSTLPPGPPSTTSDSPLIDSVKKALKTVTDGVTIGRKDANINIGVTGLTGNLEKGNKSATLGIAWGGTLKLDAKNGPFHFSGSLAKDKWEITLSFPQDTYIPDLSTLGKVFGEGEKAMGKMAEATKGFDTLNDATKVAAVMKPHATAVQEAVDAFSGAAKAKAGPSFGLKFGSPNPMPGEENMPKGVQGTIVFTYVF